MPFGRLLKGLRGADKKLPLLYECLECHIRFTNEDVERHRFYVETCICRACYLLGMAKSPHIWCFGKRQTKSSPGYSEKNIGCRLLCPDRKICKRFVNKYNKEK